MRLCFAQTPHRNNDKTLGKLVIFEDGSPAIRIEEEIKTNKFMMETKL